MAKSNKTSKVSAKSEASSKSAVQVKANPRLVAAIRGHVSALDEARSYLIHVAEIIKNEQLTKEEVIVSLMEARGIERSTAESQFSRTYRHLADPVKLEAVRSGEMSLKEVREAGTKKQSNPSKKQKEKNLEKRMTSALTSFLNACKEIGADLKVVIETVKSAAKKAGIR